MWITSTKAAHIKHVANRKMEVEAEDLGIQPGTAPVVLEVQTGNGRLVFRRCRMVEGKAEYLSQCKSPIYLTVFNG